MDDTWNRTPPDDLDWRSWVDRWDRMQERYLVKRAERLDVITRLIGETQNSVIEVVDLGCGTGSLMLGVLDALPDARVIGIDVDPTLLWLARARLASFGERSRIERKDLRDPSWLGAITGKVDAVVSATALHWLSPHELSDLYHQVSQVLKPGGIFLNADHVGSDHPTIQRAWEEHRAEMLRQESTSEADDWVGFWAAYASALGLDITDIHRRVFGAWDGGIDEGLPLAWHLDRLRENDFDHVDCFWRSDCDAVYGGIRK